MSTPFVDTADLVLAAGLVVANAGLSMLLRARLARTLLVAATRMVVQLLLVGLVLRTVFELQSPWLVGAVVLAMLASAGREIAARQERHFAGAWRHGLGAGTTAVATLLVTAAALLMIGPHPWFAPQVAIPLLGILLGSVMNGVGISLDTFSAGVLAERAAIEARLALGATRFEALGTVQRRALRSGMIPIVNQMSAAGIITLPGMMTGQILAGMPPVEAAKYQVFTLLLLGAGAGFGALAAITLAVRRVTDERHRLRLDRLET